MLFRTLHGKLAASLLCLLCLAACVAVPLSLEASQQYRQQVDQSVNRSLASTLAAHLGELGLLHAQTPVALAKARSDIKRLMVINPEIDVYLLDANGNVLAYSGDSDKVLRRRIALGPLRSFLAGHRPLPILGDDPRSIGQRKVFTVAPYPNGSRSPGYVYVILGGERYASVADLLGKSYVLRSSAWALVSVFALIAAAGLLLFQLLTRRLQRLAAIMDSFQADGFQERRAPLPVPIAVPGRTALPDEIDRLGAVFAEMSDRIQSQVRRLALADRHRREMVSNVSHDLRTPLAALQGYLETLIMKEGTMSSEEQHGYLEVALRQSSRLASLVSELFELAQLDAHEVQIHPEPFSISELAQDIVQQHRLAAQRKGIHLEAALPEGLPFVYADIALIERVLNNLLENALRYTPEGGTVAVTVALQTPEIAVAVSDTGSGILPDDLPHVFERFYRAADQPAQPAGSSGSAGLGLAIAKRILELHGTNIEVASAPGDVTAFTFRLPLGDGLQAKRFNHLGECIAWNVTVCDFSVKRV